MEPEIPLTMTYMAEDETEKLEGVDVSPDGSVTIGVPLITAVAVPPPDDEQKEND